MAKKTKAAKAKTAADFTRKDYAALVDELHYHNKKYYLEDEPEISDADYDDQMRLLKEVEVLHPDWVQPDSPSLKVGGEVREDFAEVPPSKFFRLKPEGEVRLKGAYIIKCVRWEKDAEGNITKIICTYDPTSHSGEDT